MFITNLSQDMYFIYWNRVHSVIQCRFYENRADQSYKIESMQSFKTLQLQWLVLVSRRAVSLFYVFIYIFIQAHKHRCCSVFMANLGCKCVRACARGRVRVFSWRACLSGLIPALSRQLTYLPTTLPKDSNVQLTRLRSPSPVVVSLPH